MKRKSGESADEVRLTELDRKEKKLESAISGLGRAAVAFSGGVDSTFLLKKAVDVLGLDNVLAVTAGTVLLSPDEVEACRTMARDLGVEHVVAAVDVMSIPGFVENPPERCYVCKKNIFLELIKEAGLRGFKHIMEGMNADDLGDYRPGRLALEELGILSPLLKAGLGKQEIRELSRRLGLPTADKPSAACLASRFPYGTRITAEGLASVAAAEKLLKEAGFGQVRVRHHGDTARIEVEKGEAVRLFEPGLRTAISRAFRKLGYTYIAVDLDGYRTGSLNEELPGAAVKR